jgi:hypothetical protein
MAMTPDERQDIEDRIFQLSDLIEGYIGQLANIEANIESIKFMAQGRAPQGEENDRLHRNTKALHAKRCQLKECRAEVWDLRKRLQPEREAERDARTLALFKLLKEKLYEKLGPNDYANLINQCNREIDGY